MKTGSLVWKILKYKPWLYVLNAAIWTIVGLIPLLPALIVREILDMFTLDASLDRRFWWLISLTVGLYLARIILTYAGLGVGVVYKFLVEGLLSNNLLKSILKKPGAQALKVSPSEALDRFRNDVPMISLLITWPIDIFNHLVTSTVAIFILARINLRMTFLIVVPLLLVLSVLQSVKKRVHGYREQSRQATSKVVGTMGEMFGSVQAIQVADAQTHVLNRLGTLNNARRDAAIRDTMFLKVVGVALSNVVHLGSGLILLLSAQAMQTGNFSVGDFSIFISYWLLVADFTRNLGGFVAFLQYGKVSFKRLLDLQAGSPDEELVRHEELNLLGQVKVDEVKKQEVEALSRLEVKDLCYQFASKNGIRDVSFSVEKGLTVVTGRVGSGKSTMIKVLLGLLPMDSGSIIWNETVVENPSTFFTPPRCGYTSQVPRLFSDTVKNNILLGQRDLEDSSLDAAIYSAVLEKDIAQLEAGLDTIIGPKGVKLSGGQLQRVAAARMFASNPQLYVFDDLSSALDVDTERILWSRLLERGDATCIAISTRPVALEMATKIIVMKDGQILSQGTMEEQLKTCPESQQIYSQHHVA